PGRNGDGSPHWPGGVARLLPRLESLADDRRRPAGFRGRHDAPASAAEPTQRQRAAPAGAGGAVKVQLATLLGGTFCLWGLLAIPASFLGGAGALVLSGVAAVLCLVPTTATLVWAARTPRRHPNDVLLLAVGGMGLRMTFVLGAAVALYLFVPVLHQTTL